MGRRADPGQQRRRRRTKGKEIVEDTDLKVWSEVYENAMAAVRFTRRALPHMRRGKWGRVVTITSIYGGKEGIGRPWFTMAKAAETGLMKSLSAMASPGARRHHLQLVAPGGIYIPAPASRTSRSAIPKASGAWSTRNIRSAAWARPRK